MSWTARVGLASYRIAGHLAVPIAKRKLRRRAACGKEDPQRLGERLGYASADRPAGPLVWVHGASVGESLAGLILIEALHAQDSVRRFLITSGTVTSATLLSRRLPPSAIHQYVPLDLPVAVDRFLDHWQPDAALMLESEFWPNILSALDRRRIPRALVNGRMSPESFQRWTSLRPVIARLLSGFTCCLMQSDRDAQFLSQLGARNVVVTGNLKEAAHPLEADHPHLDEMAALMGNRPRWLAASTHPGEEEIAIATHLDLNERHQGLMTILAPRHPERGREILSAVENAGLRGSLRSAGAIPNPDCDVYIADTIGEMGLWYRLCRIAFVGKSLAGVGGQNPLEPAQLGCAVLFGPKMSNFEALAAGLEQNGGAQRVVDGAELTVMVDAWLEDEARRAGVADAALGFAAGRGEALARTLQGLQTMLTAIGTGAKV